MQMSQPRGHKSRRADTTPVVYHVVVDSLPHYPLPPAIGERAGPGVTRVVELAMMPTDYRA